VVNVTDRTDVDVGFLTFKLLFCHFILQLWHFACKHDSSKGSTKKGAKHYRTIFKQCQSQFHGPKL